MPCISSGTPWRLLKKFWLSLAVAWLWRVLVVTIGSDVRTATWSVPYISRVLRMRPYKPKSCVRVGVAAQEPLVLHCKWPYLEQRSKFALLHGNDVVSIRVNETKNSKHLKKNWEPKQFQLILYRLTGTVLNFLHTRKGQIIKRLLEMTN